MTPSDLTQARTALNLSRRELAEVLGVSDSTVAHWEQGAQRIPPYLELVFDGIRLRQIMDYAKKRPDMPIRNVRPSNLTFPRYLDPPIHAAPDGHR